MSENRQTFHMSRSWVRHIYWVLLSSWYLLFNRADFMLVFCGAQIHFWVGSWRYLTQKHWSSPYWFLPIWFPQLLLSIHRFT